MRVFEREGVCEEAGGKRSLFSSRSEGGFVTETMMKTTRRCGLEGRGGG